ncbi:hypothetical protein PMAYCL1PPCAC_29778, partial [Pristionchus mayeri]
VHTRGWTMRSVLVLLLLFRCGQCMKTVMRGGRDSIEEIPSSDPSFVPLPLNRVSPSSLPSHSHIKENSQYHTSIHHTSSHEKQKRREESHPPRPPPEERIEIEIEEDENDEERSRMTRSKKVDKYPGAERLGAAFGRNDYLLPENFKTLRRQDIPVTYRLHDDLLRYYRKGTRPVKHPNQLVHVSMSVFLYQIIKLDAVKNTISLSGSFELYWKDDFLTWDPKLYDEAREIFLSSQDIWIPEFSLYYSHNFNDAVKLLSNNDVRVNYTGHIRYYIPFSTESLCKLDVKFFPFDIQQCTLLFGSWAHSNDSIKYSLYTQNLSLIDFYDNQEWELDTIHSNIKADGFLYDYLDPPLFWEMIIMDLVVVRQSFYYVFNLVIPSTIITLVAVIGFHTPSTSGRVRDAKFRLGIMTLMSMSVILLAIVEDMPKFSMWSSRRGRGSFSGIPLIGLYYFILLAIIGLSTVTTSMFVFLERDYRVKRRIPWYLRWLAFDLRGTDPGLPRSTSYNRAPNGHGDDQTTERLLSNGHVGDGLKERARGLAANLLGLISIPHGRGNQRRDEYQLHTQNEGTPSPRQALRRRMSVSQYDNLLIYQYFDQAIEDLIQYIDKIERCVEIIRKDLRALVPQDDLNSRWQTVIRRLEVMSLVFYVAVLFVTMFLFFYHDWYCAVGHNPCGQVNLKCPWMQNNLDNPTCEHNSYN